MKEEANFILSTKKQEKATPKGNSLFQNSFIKPYFS